eukprot:5168100-Pleurochrysis_carterae.AAC.1
MGQQGRSITVHRQRARAAASRRRTTKARLGKWGGESRRAARKRVAAGRGAKGRAERGLGEG